MKPGNDSKQPARESVRRDRTVSQARKVEEVRRTPVNRGAGIRATALKQVEYVDGIGRKFAVLVEEGQDPAHGVIVGPLPLDALELPASTMVRLHNELYGLHLYTYEDVRRRPQDVQSALAATYRVDIQTIQKLYAQMGLVK